MQLVKKLVCRCADHVLLNKKDMLAEGEVHSLLEIIHQLNPLAKVSTFASARRACCFLTVSRKFLITPGT